jgi:hypothetical protein
MRHLTTTPSCDRFPLYVGINPACRLDERLLLAQLPVGDWERHRVWRMTTPTEAEGIGHVPSFLNIPAKHSAPADLRHPLSSAARVQGILRV